MAKYFTVICKVKGQTVLKLIDDFNCDENHVFYHKDTEDQTHNAFDLNLIKKEVVEEEEEEEAEPLNEFNVNSCDSQESADYFDESKTFNHFWSDGNSEAPNDDNQSMDSYKKYMSVNKTSGRQMFFCKYPGCEYQTLWKNAIVNHIRSNHMFFFPFVCGYGDCGKKFAIRSNLNNHKKVHSKRSAFVGGVESLDDNTQSSADIDHNYSQNVVKEKKVFTQKTKQNYSTISDNNKPIPQDISKNIKKKSFGNLKSKPRNLFKKNIKDVSNHSNESMDTNVRPSSGERPAFVGIKSVEKYIKQTERNGKIWRTCLFPDCTYGTKYATSMVYHIRNNHLNDKPFVCLLCGKRFAMRTNLNNHKKVHKR